MNSDQSGATFHLVRTTNPSRNLRRWWNLITLAIVAACFIETAFAGAMLSGSAWAHAAHAASAVVLVVSAVTSGLIAIATVSRIPHGLKLGSTLLALGVTLFVQMVLGVSLEHGANLLWLHVPLGVALVGIAALVVAMAQKLGEE